MLLKDLRTIFREELSVIYPKEETDTFFGMMIEHFLGQERFVLALQPELNLTKEEEQPFFEGLTALKSEKPIQYVLGTTSFMGMTLKVSEQVLIPRPETEELAEWIVANCQVERSRNLKIFDIGTGSGCIAIALAKNLPKAMVHALDVSENALQVAKENATLNEVDVRFFRADILNFEPQFELESEYDCVVSNPPYVRELEKEHMKNNVKNYEPEVALFVPNENPLLYYEAISTFCENYLNSNGKLYLEINQYLAAETMALLKSYGFGKIELKKDIFGNDRMIKAVKP